MSPIAYRARALGPLRAIDWAIPSGVSVVVGPNRVGKSTLLRLPELLGRMLMVGIHEAFKEVFEDVPQPTLSEPPSTPITLALAVDRTQWEVELTVRGGQIASHPRERLIVDGAVVLQREFGNTEIEGEGCRFLLHTGPLPSLTSTAVRRAHAYAVEEAPDPNDDAYWRKYLPNAPEPVIRGARLMMPLFARGLSVLSFRTYDYEIDHLVRFGSLHSASSELERTGRNVFPLLRNWRDKPEHEARYEFVLGTMQQIFPNLRRVGFDQAGNTVTMSVSDRRWPSDASITISRESTGFITALLQLCAIASCPSSGLVTLDEIETSLHPRAIRILVEACRRWAAKHDLRVVLATQSETVLDQFRDEPSQVFVFEPKQETSPKPLTELFSPEYLSQFSLGDLFAHLEFGADTSEERTP